MSEKAEEIGIVGVGYPVRAMFVPDRFGGHLEVTNKGADGTRWYPDGKGPAAAVPAGPDASEALGHNDAVSAIGKALAEINSATVPMELAPAIVGVMGAYQALLKRLWGPKADLMLAYRALPAGDGEREALAAVALQADAALRAAAEAIDWSAYDDRIPVGKQIADAIVALLPLRRRIDEEAAHE